MIGLVQPPLDAVFARAGRFDQSVRGAILTPVDRDIMKKIFFALLLLASSIPGQNSFSQDTGADYPLILDPSVPLKDVFPVNGTRLKSDELRSFKFKLSDSAVARIIIRENTPEPKTPLVYYTIKSKTTGLAIAVSAAGRADGEKIIQWTSTLGDEQKWELRPARDGYFNLIAKHSRKFMGIRKANENEGADAIQWRDSGGDEQRRESHE